MENANLLYSKIDNASSAERIFLRRSRNLCIVLAHAGKLLNVDGAQKRTKNVLADGMLKTKSVQPSVAKNNIGITLKKHENILGAGITVTSSELERIVNETKTRGGMAGNVKSLLRNMAQYADIAVKRLSVFMLIIIASTKMTMLIKSSFVYLATQRSISNTGKPSNTLFIKKGRSLTTTPFFYTVGPKLALP